MMSEVAIGVAVFIVVMSAIMYNSLVGKKNAVDESLGSIDVYLKKRFDLVPNLVATAQTYMDHESKVLSDLTKLRTIGMSREHSVNNLVKLDQKMSDTLRGFMVTVENYPDLKANVNFLSLQASLNEIEEQLSAARRTYNATVTRLNNGVEMFPWNIMASIMGMKSRPYFEVSEMEAKRPDVASLFKKVG